MHFTDTNIDVIVLVRPLLFQAECAKTRDEVCTNFV